MSMVKIITKHYFLCRICWSSRTICWSSRSQQFLQKWLVSVAQGVESNVPCNASTLPLKVRDLQVNMIFDDFTFSQQTTPDSCLPKTSSRLRVPAQCCCKIPHFLISNKKVLKFDIFTWKLPYFLFRTQLASPELAWNLNFIYSQ